MNATTAREAEVIAGGLPIMPEQFILEVGAGEYPVTHAAAVTVSPAPAYGAIVLAIHRPDQPAGLFMGMNPDQARSVAAWLLVSADEIDGGAVKQ